MNIYYNAEYTGAHEDAHLISMGFIAEDGRGLYLEFADVPSYSITDYIRENVLVDTYFYSKQGAKLEEVVQEGTAACSKRNQQFKVVFKSTAVFDLTQWFKEILNDYPSGECIQLVSYCCHYDASLFYNLFRGNIPEYLNLICYDIAGPITHYVTSCIVDAPFSERMRDTLRNNRMEEFATNLGHPVREYDKNNSIKYAEIIKNVYEGLKDSKKASQFVFHLV